MEKERLPEVSDFKWSVLIVKNEFEDGRVTYYWRVEAPTLIDDRLENVRRPKEMDFENALQRLKEKYSKDDYRPGGTTVYSNVWDGNHTTTKEECVEQFMVWANGRFDETKLFFAYSYEEHQENLKTITREIIEGEEYGRYPFNEKNGYKLKVV